MKKKTIHNPADAVGASQSLDWYELPEYYDMVFDPDTVREADFLEAAVARYATVDARRALEPACGTGRLVRALAERGWSVTGFDASAAMLRYARRRCEGVKTGATRFAEGRMEHFECGTGFTLAYCLVSTFRYLHSHRDARRHLECVARALAPGGVYVLGLHLCEYNDRESSSETWRADRDGVRVVSTLEAQPADRWRRSERCEVRLQVERDGDRRHYEHAWSFRTYDDDQILALVRSVPALELVAVHDFDYDIEHPDSVAMEGDRLDVVLVLRRRTSA